MGMSVNRGPVRRTEGYRRAHVQTIPSHHLVKRGGFINDSDGNPVLRERECSDEPGGAATNLYVCV